MKILHGTLWLVAIALMNSSFASPLDPKLPRSWEEASSKARAVRSKLTLKEKLGIVTGGYRDPNVQCAGFIGGVESIDFTGLCLSDGPAGHTKADKISVFPAGLTTAATWDKTLIYQRGVALGNEFREKGAHIYLGPVSGPLGRNALGGRNWEAFGPDPYLSGIAMYESVSGVQSTGVQACSKHFVGNEQETQRTRTENDDGSIVEAVSSNIDDRTLHELYAWPFANAIKAGTASIMCSYNRVNGTYACENDRLLNKVLKEELGFQGYVVSDWHATHSTNTSALGGLDMEMPGPVSELYGDSYFGDELLDAVKQGKVSEKRIDEMVDRVLTPYYLLGQDKGFPSIDPSSRSILLHFGVGYLSPYAQAVPQVEARDVRGNHAKLIRKIGAAGTVLLKNIEGTLPLKSKVSIGVFGNGAPLPEVGSVYFGESEEGFETGTLDIGGGSGSARHTNLVSPLDAIRARSQSQGGRVQAIVSNEVLADGVFNYIYPLPDVCLVFLKAYAREGFDRPSLELQWNSTRVVEQTAAICPNTVVITHGPGVVLMPWAGNENVTAILAAHYPGEETGNAIADVLWGTVEPSGRLPYTIPKQLSDYGPPISQPESVDPQVDFSEGLLIDYRHFDAAEIEPLYEFGFGLSYTSFQMGRSLQLQVAKGLTAQADPSKGIAPGGKRDLWTSVATVTVTVTNTGKRTGATVPQLYVSFPKATTPKNTPLKVLRGFEKVTLAPGKTTKVPFELTRRDLSYWDVSKQQWVVPKGEFTFFVGFSSRDLVAQISRSILT
ncbi:glycosyl hydrolase family 3 N terminal domain-containing protein [Thelonectria olida]|uniref:Beta-glucosidase cel3A n=1 Tax=Thelonectria olida TaxID=1576542 RepID=A0A9P8VXU8_9HYPO|nr:glycosyl hydrolase family 3 N terminal domain-containing protein [Thelonectria olida]